MRKPYHKIIFAHIRILFGYIGYFCASLGKGCRPRFKDYVSLDKLSDIQEKYDDKRVMERALDYLKTDYQENKMMEKLITERKRKNYKYKDDSAEMDFLQTGDFNMETKSIMIVGVGGQGSLLASRIIGNVLLSQGYDVKVSEVHGMSQRGGSVVTYVKYGEKVYSPIVEKGEADIVISFELLEAARCLPYLRKGGKMITSVQKIDPMPVITGAAEYPSDLVEKLKSAGADVTAVDALSLAEQAGTSKASNVVLMGVLSSKMDFSEEVWQKALEQCVPPKFLELNKKAFALGRASV